MFRMCAGSVDLGALETITGRLTCFVHALATSTLAVVARKPSCNPPPPCTALPIVQGHVAACLVRCVQGNSEITTVTANYLTNAGTIEIGSGILVRGGGWFGWVVRWLQEGHRWACV